MIKETHPADRELLADLNLLEEGFTRIGSTVRNLLDLNRPGQSGKQPTDLNHVIRTTTALVHDHLEKNRIRLDLQLSPEIPPLVASPQQLGHLFLNLINNAVDAMRGQPAAPAERPGKHPGGALTISTRLSAGHVAIAVQDTGPGIAPDRLKDIFDPFYTEKKRMGMGIGLSICHDIVLDHQGTIVAGNVADGGARFDISLPVGQDINEGYYAKT